MLSESWKIGELFHCQINHNGTIISKYPEDTLLQLIREMGFAIKCLTVLDLLILTQARLGKTSAGKNLWSAGIRRKSTKQKAPNACCPTFGIGQPEMFARFWALSSASARAALASRGSHTSWFAWHIELDCTYLGAPKNEPNPMEFTYSRSPPVEVDAFWGCSWPYWLHFMSTADEFDDLVLDQLIPSGIPTWQTLKEGHVAICHCEPEPG